MRMNKATHADGKSQTGGIPKLVAPKETVRTGRSACLLTFEIVPPQLAGKLRTADDLQRKDPVT